MSSNENMDQLTKDAADALAKGMTYGKYIAWKQNQGKVPEKPVQREPQEGEAYCKCCGKIFTKGKWNRVYCSSQCRTTQYERKKEGKADGN